MWSISCFKLYLRFSTSAVVTHFSSKPILYWLPQDLEDRFLMYKKNLYLEYANITSHVANAMTNKIDLSNRWNKLRPIVDIMEELDVLLKADEEIEKLVADIVDSDENHEDENELKEIAKIEQEQRCAHRHSLEQKLLQLLAPVDDESLESGVVLEIIPGAGGREAGLFAREMLNMYSCLARERDWNFEVKQETMMIGEESTSSGSESPLSYARFEIIGLPSEESGVLSLGAYGQLRCEAGVHRVQRIPVTSKQHKIHTSTVAVTVLPISENFEVSIPESDLKWDFFRASGAGGQHVNRTDSAVRLTHLPTGTIVTCQQERAQHHNKRIAFEMLQEKLRDGYLKSQYQIIDSIRRSHKGNLDRSEKIRTYNYQQDRVTDHRLGISWNGIERFMKQTTTLSEAIRMLFEQEQIKRIKDLLIDNESKQK